MDGPCKAADRCNACDAIIDCIYCIKIIYCIASIYFITIILYRVGREFRCTVEGRSHDHTEHPSAGNVEVCTESARAMDQARRLKGQMNGGYMRVSYGEYAEFEDVFPLRDDSRLRGWMSQVKDLASSSAVSIREAVADGPDGRRMRGIQLATERLPILQVKNNVHKVAE